MFFELKFIFICFFVKHKNKVKHCTKVEKQILIKEKDLIYSE